MGLSVVIPAGQGACHGSPKAGRWRGFELAATGLGLCRVRPVLLVPIVGTMISRLSGTLESLDANLATLRPSAALDLALTVLVPAYLVRRLTTQVGTPVTFHTLTYLESPDQGSSFVPRLVGFASPTERAFFELFTTVKGIGTRKAVRALAEEPPLIAAAITRRDAKALTELPEIGKRLAETIIAELSGKADAFADTAQLSAATNGRGPVAMAEPRAGRLPPAAEDALNALLSLGETRADAERKLSRVLDQLGVEADTGRLLAAVYGSR